MKELETIDIKPIVENSTFELKDKISYWNADFINSHINQIKNKTHKTFFFLLWRTGMRVSEALAIEKQHINFDEDKITIRWLKKRKALTRNVPLHPDLKNILDYYTHNMKYNEKLFSFTRQRADQLAKRHFKGNCHKFRHSFAVNWLKSGGELFYLSKMLGHSSVKVTEIYLEVTVTDTGKELLKVKF